MKRSIRSLDTFYYFGSHSRVHLNSSNVFRLCQDFHGQVSGTRSNFKDFVRRLEICLVFTIKSVKCHRERGKTNGIDYPLLAISMCDGFDEMWLTNLWHVCGFLRICCPNRSVLKIGLVTDPEVLPSCFLGAGRCTRENF